MFASQRDPALYGPYIAIDSYWTSASPSTIYVASNCQQVELFVNGASKGKISPNAYTALPHPFFQFNNITFASGRLRADCWLNSQVVATTTQFTPGQPTKLVLTPDDTTLQADGADMTRVVVKALNANNQMVPFNAAAVGFTLQGPGALVGENPLTLEAGRGAVYVKSILGKTGAVTLSASAAGLTAAAPIAITIGSMTASIVPTSGNYTAGVVTDINNTSSAGDPSARFTYSAGWQHGSAAGGLFNGDNSWSNTANSTASLTFTGNRVVLYGVLDASHGSGAVSIDGGKRNNGELPERDAAWRCGGLEQPAAEPGRPHPQSARDRQRVCGARSCRPGIDGGPHADAQPGRGRELHALAGGGGDQPHRLHRHAALWTTTTWPAASSSVRSTPPRRAPRRWAPLRQRHHHQPADGYQRQRHGGERQPGV